MFGCCGILFYKMEAHEEERREETRRVKKERETKEKLPGVDQCSISHTDCSSPEQRIDSNMFMSNSTLCPGRDNFHAACQLYLVILGLTWTARSARNKRPATAIRSRAAVSRQRQRIHVFIPNAVLSRWFSHHGPPQHHRLPCPD